MLEVTHRLGGANYVLWGGREGYDTLLNTDLRREGDQLARFLHLVAEHKHRIGFEGTLLIEPKPMEPTKHQYDYDSATVHGFLVRNGLEDEYRLNIEANHATLAGHSFHHEVAYAVANGILGSIDANRGDPQNGWDTDQFPNSVEDLALPLYEILRGGGFTTGGFNFDAKLRRQSIDRTDLFHGPHRRHRHARTGTPRRGRPAREPGALGVASRSATPAGAGRSGRAILEGGESLASLEAKVAVGRDRPAARVGSPGVPREPREPGDLGGRRTSPRRDRRQALSGAGRARTWPSSSGSTSRRRRPRPSSSTSRASSRASGTSEYGFEIPHPRWSEQDPGLWWDGTVAAVRDVLERTGAQGGDVAAVGLTGQMHGAVLLDAA